MSSFLEYISLSWDHVLELAIGHAIVVAIALVIDIVIGVALGVLVYRRESAANVALAITSTFLTIPSFALFGLFIDLRPRLPAGGRRAGHVRAAADLAQHRCRSALRGPCDRGVRTGHGHERQGGSCASSCPWRGRSSSPGCACPRCSSWASRRSRQS